MTASNMHASRNMLGVLLIPAWCPRISEESSFLFISCLDVAMCESTPCLDCMLPEKECTRETSVVLSCAMHGASIIPSVFSLRTFRGWCGVVVCTHTHTPVQRVAVPPQREDLRNKAFFSRECVQRVCSQCSPYAHTLLNQTAASHQA
mgnify:CR=1 FL=1